MTGVHFMIGIMPILRSSFSFKDLPTVINGAHLQRTYWSILMITADQLQKTVYGIYILTIPQQTQIWDLKHVDCSPKQIIITVAEEQKMSM